MSYLGDFNAGVTVRKTFTTVTTTGAPTQLAGTPAVSVYKDGSTTQSTAGVSLTVDLDGVTGLNQAVVDTSADGTFYSAGSDFSVVITTGTVGGTSVVGYVVGTFSIENRNDKADVREFGGSAGTFSGGRPEVNTSHAAGTAWGSGAITAASIAADAITAAKIANGAIDAATFAADVDAEILSYLVDDATRIDASALNTAAGTTIPDIQARLPAALVGGRIDATVDGTGMESGAVNAIIEACFTYDATATYATAAAGSLVKEIADNAGGSALTEAGIADAVWDEALAGHVAAGSAGERLGRVPNVAAGAAGGLFIAGSNAATTFATLTVTGAFLVSGGATYTNAAGAGFTCSSTGGAGDGIRAVGHTSGKGINASGGSSGTGIYADGSGNGYGMALFGAGAGAGLYAGGGGTGYGVYFESGASGLGALTLVGNGATPVGMVVTGSIATSGTVTFNALTVSGATTLTGNVSLGGTLGVTGTTTLAALTTTGTATLNALTVSGATTLTGAVTASNASNNIVGIDVAKVNGTAQTAGDLAALLATIDNFLDTEIADIKTVTDQLTAAQAEPSAVPAANATPLQKLAWLAALARNKITQTATTQTLLADDGTTPVATSAVSDDATTFTRGEWT